MSVMDMTLADAVKFMIETSAKTQANLDRTQSNLDRYIARADATIAEIKNWNRTQSNLDKYIARADATIAEIKNRNKDTDGKVKQALQVVGSFKLNLGELIELVLMPKLRMEVNKNGHEFNVMSPNKLFHYRDGNEMTEVDLLLENGDEVMAIEIKSNCTVDDVRRHLNRLKILRKNEDITGMKNRVMYAAIAGITIRKPVRELAQSLGMYIITVREEEERVNVIPPGTKKHW